MLRININFLLNQYFYHEPTNFAPPPCSAFGRGPALSTPAGNWPEALLDAFACHDAWLLEQLDF